MFKVEMFMFKMVMVEKTRVEMSCNPFKEPVEATCWANMFANLCEKLQDNFPRGLDMEMGRDTNAGKVYGYLTVSR